MEIREIKPEDMQSLAALYVAVFAAEPWNEVWEVQWAKDRLNTLFHSPGYYGLMVVNQHAPIGAALGRAIPFQQYNKFELIEFYVDPPHQKQGVGKTLLQALESGAAERGCHGCTLLTARGIDAESFYVSSGYRRNDNMVFMSKKL